MGAPRKKNTHVKQPWEMKSSEWSEARSALRPCNAQSNFTRASGTEATARMDALLHLLFDAHQEARDRLRAAENGEIKMPSKEAFRLLEQVNTKISHLDVVVRALRLGMPVPEDVLEEYPKITARPEGVSDYEWAHGWRVIMEYQDVNDFELMEELIDRVEVSRETAQALCWARDDMFSTQQALRLA